MITKTKTNYHIELSTAKKHLRIDDVFAADDDMIEGLIEAAIEICENYIEKDIAITSNVMKLPDYVGSSVVITEGNLINVTGITAGTTTIDVSGCTVYINRDYFMIELPQSYDCNNTELIVEFQTGFQVLPKAIKSAVLIQLGDLYDVDRSNYTFNNYSNNKTSERLLNYYRAIYLKHYDN